MVELQSNLSSVYSRPVKGAWNVHTEKVVEEKKDMKQDKMTIRADYKKITEENLKTRLIEKIRFSIRQENASKAERIGELSEMVQQGTYQIDAARIAEIILLNERGLQDGNGEIEDFDL